MEFDDLIAALGGRYRVVRELGRGGMAIVYLTEDLKHRRQVAVKVLLPELAAALGSERFLREIEIAARLNHPHILPLFDSGDANGLLYYVMPYVKGESLRDRLTSEKQLPLEEALRIAREVAHALDYAHRQDVIHRDIKPENILLVDGQAVVADFGVARAIHAAGGDKLTATGIAVGSPMYMSPEQAGGIGEIDGRSDTYALACVLYEMLAGQPPFSGPTVDSVLRQHMTAEPPKIAHIRPGVPTEIAETVHRALAKPPADRFRSAALFAEALSRAASGETRSTSKKRQWRFAIGAAAIATVAIVAILRVAAPSREGGANAASRVVVTPFENRTGVGELDPLGTMVAEWVTQGLAEAPFLTVLDRRGVQADASAPGAADPTAVGRRTSAQFVVAGSYFLQGDSLRFQARIVSAADGSILSVIANVTAPRSRPLEGAEHVRQRVLTALASLNNEDVASFEIRPAQPPTYAAYREYTDGLEAYLRTAWNDAGRHFDRAAVLDTSFLTADVWAAMTWVGVDNARFGPIMSRLQLRQDRLGSYDRARFGYIAAGFVADQQESYRWALRTLEAAPGSVDARREAAISALRVFRGREALYRLRELDPQRGLLRHWVDYWSASAWVHHMLGEHRDELALARRGRKEAPTNGHFRLLELRALAALLRVAELDSIVRADFPAFPGRIGIMARVAAGELWAHGDSAAARRLLQDAAEQLAALGPSAETSRDWLEQHMDLTNLSGDRETYLANPQPSSDDASAAISILAQDEWLHQRAELALLLGNADEAERLAAQLHDPDAHRLLPARIAAAQRQDAAARAALARSERRYLRHWPNLRGLALDRAGVLLRLGDRNAALDILTEGLSKGLIPDSRWGNDGHARVDLAPLWSDPRFVGLVKPKE